MNRSLLAFGLALLLAGAVGCTSNSDIVCDQNGCISLSKFSANIASTLNSNAVGYVFYVASLPATFAGQARTAADQPSFSMLPDLPMNVASVTKTLTTIGVLQSLANHPPLTIDSKILPFLYPDWPKGPNIDTITFRDLLTHRAGFRVDCNGANTTYAVLKSQIGLGVKLADKAAGVYNNCNFAIFREMLPFMEGQNITGTDVQRAAASASFYINYMNQHVFQPVGVSWADCKPPAGDNPAFPNILTYPFPPGATHGNDWGDWTLACGGGGWVLKASDLDKVLNDLAGGKVLLTSAQKAQMNLNCLGWDCSVRSDCPSPYVCKNGDLGGILWTYLGIFKCSVPVVVMVNSTIQGMPSNDIIGIVNNAYQGAGVPIPSGATQPVCPASQ